MAGVAIAGDSEERLIIDHRTSLSTLRHNIVDG